MQIPLNKLSPITVKNPKNINTIIRLSNKNLDECFKAMIINFSLSMYRLKNNIILMALNGDISNVMI